MQRLSICLALILGWALAVPQAGAQSASGKPIRVIVPLTAGGSVDLIVRPVATEMSKVLSRPVIVENRPGGGTNIAGNFVAKSAPDGSTLLITVAAVTIQPGVNPKMPYDPEKELAGVTVISDGTMLLVDSPKIPARNVRELVAYAKANPGKLSFGSVGTGGSLHLAGELLKMEGGIDIVHVPYKGGSEMLNDLMGGRIDLAFTSAAVALPGIKAGKMVPLAIASANKSSLFPGLPLLSDTYRGFVVSVRNGVMVRRGTPKEVINSLNRTIVGVLATPTIKETFNKAGVEPVSSTPEEFDAEIHEEIQRWSKVAHSIGLVLEE